MADLVRWLRGEARALGFAEARVCAPDAIPHAAPRLREAIAAGHLADMAWMADTAERRAAPRAMWPDVRSVVMLGLDYGPRSDPLGVLERPDRAGISVYARHRDYHDVVKGKLKTLAQKLLAEARRRGRSGRAVTDAGSMDPGPDDHGVKVFVDTAPLMEKPLAEAAGLGWQGKHTNLVSRTHGSWLFLGAILTTLDLPYDPPEADHCGSCRRCLDACPTNAFPAPYRLDARRCISYLTIENAGPIPREFRAAMGNRVYGCDDCLAVCPWNKFAGEARVAKLAEPDGWVDPPLAELLALDDAGFRARFSGSPVKRIGRDRFVRNCLVAAGNSGEGTLIAPARALLADPSPLVRGAAVWALSRLLSRDHWTALRGSCLPDETDRGVQEEWQ